MFAGMTIEQFYRHSLQALLPLYPPGEATAITQQLMETMVGIGRKELLIQPAQELSEEQQQPLLDALAQLLQYRPLQYVTGSTWFAGLKFTVNESVLIPRPETEELVQWILEDHSHASELSLLDIGTGSGCIPITIHHHNPQIQCSAVDVSEAALQVARTNAADSDTAVHFIQLDFLEETNWNTLPAFDIIVSNPPYIPQQEAAGMDVNVSRYEPALALFVPDESPLLFYEKIAAFTQQHLTANGSVYLETHASLAKETAALLEPLFSKVIIRKDLSGNDRMIKATQFR